MKKESRERHGGNVDRGLGGFFFPTKTAPVPRGSPLPCLSKRGGVKPMMDTNCGNHLLGSLCLCLHRVPISSPRSETRTPTEIAPASPPPPPPPPPFCQLVKLAHDFGFLERGGHTETAYWRGGAAAFWAPPHWSAQSRAAPFNTTTSTTTTRTVTHTKRRGVDTQEPHWTSPSPACCSPRCIQIGPVPRLLSGVYTWKN
ncbi:hypothetical protein VPH35_030311 [Triticum aestivum]